jgi:hypothetical protein
MPGNIVNEAFSRAFSLRAVGGLARKRMSSEIWITKPYKYLEIKRITEFRIPKQSQ